MGVLGVNPGEFKEEPSMYSPHAQAPEWEKGPQFIMPGPRILFKAYAGSFQRYRSSGYNAAELRVLY